MEILPVHRVIKRTLGTVKNFPLFLAAKDTKKHKKNTKEEKFQTKILIYRLADLPIYFLMPSRLKFLLKPDAGTDFPVDLFKGKSFVNIKITGSMTDNPGGWAIFF